VTADAGAVSQGRKLAAQSAKRAAETATKAQPNAAALAGVAASFVDGCVSHEAFLGNETCMQALSEGSAARWHHPYRG